MFSNWVNFFEINFYGILVCMKNTYVSFDSSRKISSSLSILLVLSFCVLIGFLALRSAENIIASTEDSPVFHMKNRSGGNDASMRLE